MNRKPLHDFKSTTCYGKSMVKLRLVFVKKQSVGNELFKNQGTCKILDFRIQNTLLTFSIAQIQELDKLSHVNKHLIT